VHNGQAKPVKYSVRGHLVTWNFVGSSFDGQSLFIEGIDVWTRGWIAVEGERAKVVDPRYGQSFQFPIFVIAEGEKSVRFAAGEFSNGVWGFYREA
jgi:hypothetical protein